MDGMPQQHKPQIIYELIIGYETDSSTSPNKALDQLLLKHQREKYQAAPYFCAPEFEQHYTHAGQ
eukprot:8222076-Karenia_brevis.AAC.1